nr:hypothetical protein [Tissierella sp.]
MLDNYGEDSKYSDWSRKVKKRVENNFANIFMTLILLLIFLICIYRIFGTRNYDLKYTYYVAVASLYMIILGTAFSSALKQIEEREVKGKRYNRIIVFIATVLSLITLSISLYSFISINISSSRQLTLNNLVAPESIWINKDSDSNYFIEPELEFGVEEDNAKVIKASEDIQQILNDLESKEIKNLKMIDAFNFIRLKKFGSNNYTLFFDYEDYYASDEGLDKGYIGVITIASNGEIMIEERYYNFDNLLIGGERIAYYPINFSVETMDLIESYMDMDKTNQANKE